MNADGAFAPVVSGAGEPGTLCGLFNIRKAFNWSVLMDLLKTVILIGIAVGAAGLVYVFVFLPWQLRRGATNADLQRTLPGDDLVTNLKTGYT